VTHVLLSKSMQESNALTVSFKLSLLTVIITKIVLQSMSNIITSLI